MAKIRYYLIRRDMREFLGPMDIDEFKKRLNRMEFGMQDEISGHCGPWVILDHKDELTDQYPEITKIVIDTLPLSWRETTGHAQVISVKDKHKPKVSPQPPLTRFRALRIVLPILIAIGCLSYLYVTFKKDDLPSPAELTILASKADPSEFLGVMSTRILPSIQKFNRSQKTLAPVLPFLRMYAFYTTGMIDGVSYKAIRGDQSQNAPTDCTVDYWKRKWRENYAQTLAFINGQSFNKNPWTKMLVLDPYWVRRRSVKGWIKPRNFYEGCLMTAATALKSLQIEQSQTPPDLAPDQGYGEAVISSAKRLQQQLDIVSNGKLSSLVDKSSIERPTVLGTLTCLESQATIVDLDHCKNPFDVSFKPMLDERSVLSSVRIAISQSSGSFDSHLAPFLQQNVAKINSEDVMSHLDQNAEFKLTGYLLSTPTIDQAIGKAESEFVDVRFR